jgi:HSP20 family molecular chaperone IbpA
MKRIKIIFTIINAGSYTRNFRLEGIQEELMRAEYQDGILRIHLPKDL